MQQVDRKHLALAALEKHKATLAPKKPVPQDAVKIVTYAFDMPSKAPVSKEEVKK